MQGGKNWFLPKEMNANRFVWDSHWLEIWSNHFYPSMGPNGGSVAMDSVQVFENHPQLDLFQNKLLPMSLSKVWNENERFRLVFTKMLVFVPKTGSLHTGKGL
jgi:hypothetical protein